MPNPGKVVRAGLLGGLAMEVLALLMYQTRMTPLSMSRYEGGLLTGEADRLSSRAAGVGAHLVLSVLIAVPYALVMKRTRPASPGIGSRLGILHWLIASLVLPGLDRMNPMVRTGRMPALKIFASGYGPVTMALFLTGHLVYGAVVGAVYDSDEGK